VNRLKLTTAAIVGVIVCIVTTYGDESGTFQLKLTPSGFASMEIGEIVNGGINSKTNKSMDNTSMKQVITGLSVNAAFSERSSLKIGLEMQMYNDFPISLTQQPQYRYNYFYPYLSQAEYKHVFGDPEKPYVTLSAGYFPFKYNRDVRNLGEYLFRTGTYPQYILNDIDFPLARLMGVHAGYTPIQNLKIDAVLFTNTQWFAVGDWSLAAIASYTIADFIDVGLGGSLNSIISSDSTLTTPHDPATAYHITYNETTGKGDTSFYSFKGAKLMARAAIDLKKIIVSNLFGKEDLRLYAETAILGLKDYPQNLRGGISYDKILDRIPIMAGLNIPAFKYLDVLSTEVEWFNCPFPNDIGAITQQGLPIPGPITENGSTDYRALSMYAQDNWKWSLYASKTIAKNYKVMLQVACDHLRSLAVNDQNVDFEEVLHSPNQWYCMLKLTAGF